MAQVKVGTVVSDKMQKTVVVEVQFSVWHPFYKKQIKRTRKFKVHDELGVKVGQKVKIVETRPIAGNVHFKVLEMLN